MILTRNNALFRENSRDIGSKLLANMHLIEGQMETADVNKEIGCKVPQIGGEKCDLSLIRGLFGGPWLNQMIKE